MSINPISGNAQQPLSSAATTVAAPLQSEAAQHAAAIPSKQDSVHLTATAQAKALKLAGQTAAQIAVKLGVDVKTVDSYLSIKVAPVTLPSVAPVAAVAKPVATNTTATPQSSAEPAAQKATEVAQGKK